MKPVVFIVGPTAVGKTDISIKVAKALNGEIISCDSMQIYQHMDIGSAKATAEEQAQCPHHLIDFVDPKDGYSVADYREKALKKIEEIHAKGKVPVVTGGTGLYVNALIYEMDFNETVENQSLRDELQKYVDEHGNEALHQRLVESDPEAGQRIHHNNVKRVIRAIEVVETTGKPLKDFAKDPVLTNRFLPILMGLTRNRKKLYSRINKRVELMLEAGLLEEIKGLKKLGLDDTFISMQGIGYKEVLPYLDEKYDYDTMVSLIKLNSRRYAKRQMTWFKRYPMLTWYDVDKYENVDQVVEAMLENIKRKIEEGTYE